MLNTRLGTRNDIGAAVVFFASKEAEWINGQTLARDLGQPVDLLLSGAPDRFGALRLRLGSRVGGARIAAANVRLHGGSVRLLCYFFGGLPLGWRNSVNEEEAVFGR